MSSTHFSSGTVITSAWLNDVNDTVYGTINAARQPWGMVGDGVYDNSVILQAAIDYAESIGGGTVFVPEGAYVLNTPINLKRKVRIQGAGMDSTVFYPTFSGYTFTLDLTYLTPFPGSPDASVGFDNFSINARTFSSVSGIKLVNCRYTNIHSVKFRGTVNCVYIDRGRAHSVTNIFVEGTPTLPAGSITFESTDTADYVYEVHAQDIHFWNNYTTGMQSHCIKVKRGALVEVSKASINDGSIATPGSGTTFIRVESDCQGCFFSDMVVSSCAYGIALVGSGIVGYPTYCHFTNIDVYQPRTAGILLDGAVSNVFTGCKVSSYGVVNTITAVVIQNSSSVCQFNSCHFDKYDGVGGQGVSVTSSTAIQFSNCVFSNLTTGIQFGASATSIGLTNNLFATVTTQVSGTPGQSGNYLKNNTGYRPTSNLAPAVPATATPVSNATGHAVTVYLTGGTVSAVIVNGITTGLTSGHFRLDVADSIQINYTVAPTWVWVPSWG